MPRLTTLLALTDLSAPSRHAATRAAMLARDTGARLELLHVFETGVLDELRKMLGRQQESVVMNLLNEAREALMQLAATVGDPVSPHLATGQLMQEVTAQAEASDADLIVLGARGAGFMRHMLLGSTAERLLGKTLRPLLVVRQVPRAPYRRVLVAVDFSPLSTASLRFAHVVAPTAGIVLFNAFEVPFEGKLHLAGVEERQIQQYRAAAQQHALRGLQETTANAELGETDYLCLATHGEPATRILEQVEEQDIDLIVVGKYGKGMTKELLLGSTTKHVLSDAGCDVLVIQHE